MSGNKDGLLYCSKSSLDHSSTSFTSWLGWLKAQSPQYAASSHVGILSPTDSNRLGTWLYYFLTCIPLFFRFFTQVHLLSDGSVEGQYITTICTKMMQKVLSFTKKEHRWVLLQQQATNSYKTAILKFIFHCQHIYIVIDRQFRCITTLHYD